MDFLFATALWALPLASLPILLHLLYRRKSPVIPFSTLRFVKTSIQRTAARRRVQKWLLLACRALLIALLIWAVAQPAKKLAGTWSNGDRSTIAAIVIDSSYSMQLQDGQVTLLNKADSIVQDLLRGELSRAKVVIFHNQQPSQPETLRDASAVLAEWAPLQPLASRVPLIDRVSAAVALLDRQPADQKWLLVLSDFQSKEFGRPLPDVKGGQPVLLDLHPAETRSAGVTRVTISPQQPIPGITSEAVVEITGRPGDARAVILKTSAASDGASISQNAPAMANLDAGGRAVVRFPLKLPPQRWVTLDASLTADDAMAWDNERSTLIEVPPKQAVTLLSPDRFVKLGLDPSEGKLAEWPLAVSSSTRLTGHEDVAVEILSEWPSAQQATALRDFARAGHSVILFVQPGLEDSWAALPAATKHALSELLPSPPGNGIAAGAMHAAVADANDPLVEGLTDDRFQLRAITLRHIVPFTANDAKTTAVLNAVAADPAAASRPQGLLFRRPIGAGVCYTIATTPDPRYTNLATHPTFLPLLVRMCLRTSSQSTAQNIELGQPLTLDVAAYPGVGELQLDGPQHDQYRIMPTTDTAGRRQFVYAQTDHAGLYTWRKIADGSPLAMANVQPPAAESELAYRPAKTVASSPDTVIATSAAELQSKIAKQSEPQPQWSAPIAIVLLLLCVEALMGSISSARPASTSRSFVPAVTAQA